MLTVDGNTLQGNNGRTGRELLVENEGGGEVFLFLDNNTSLNTVAPGQFNFDFLNTGGGAFNVFESNNVGTVGSSDGSVIIP